MDWIIVVLFLTNDGKLEFLSSAERLRFNSGIDCNAHYKKYKTKIDKSVHRRITEYSEDGYKIQHIGCIHWGIKKKEIDT